jgi:hypothetical protein
MGQLAIKYMEKEVLKFTVLSRICGNKWVEGAIDQITCSKGIVQLLQATLILTFFIQKHNYVQGARGDAVG